MRDRVSFEELRTRNNEAVRRFYAQQFPEIVRFITSNKGTLDEARDVFHDALYLLLYEAEQGVIQPSENLTRRLYSIVVVLWNEVLKEKLVDPDTVAHTMEYDLLEQSRLLNLLRRIKKISAKLKGLAEPGRTIVREHGAREVPLAEIAGRMGFSDEESAARNYYKAIRQLLITS